MANNSQPVPEESEQTRKRKGRKMFIALNIEFTKADQLK